MFNISDLPPKIQVNLRILGNHWIWIGPGDKDRNSPKGRLYFNGKMEAAHRVIFHLLTGFDLNSKLQVNHKLDCQISLCCHPDCLYTGTQKDNIQDSILLGNNNNLRKTHCPNGHEYHISPTTGHRYCQTCKNQRRDEWRKRNKVNTNGKQNSSQSSTPI